MVFLLVGIIPDGFHLRDSMPLFNPFGYLFPRNYHSSFFYHSGDLSLVGVELSFCVSKMESMAEAFGPARLERKTTMPRPSMDHAFTWTTEVYDRDGNFADERKSKAHVTDPDDRSMTLCGREIPRHATTDSADGADYCKRCERAVDRLNAERSI